MLLVEQELLTLPVYLNVSIFVWFSFYCILRFLCSVLQVIACPFSFGYCIVRNVSFMLMLIRICLQHPFVCHIRYKADQMGPHAYRVLRPVVVEDRAENTDLAFSSTRYEVELTQFNQFGCHPWWHSVVGRESMVGHYVWLTEIAGEHCQIMFFFK